MNIGWDIIEGMEDLVCIGCGGDASEEKDGDLYCYQCMWNNENFRQKVDRRFAEKEAWLAKKYWREDV